ncbi:MAG: PAS domain-containing protein [Thermoguttaceae bacterium]
MSLSEPYSTGNVAAPGGQAVPGEPAASEDAHVRSSRPAASRTHDAVLALGRRAVAAPDPAVLVDDAARLIAEIAGTEFALIAQSEKGTAERLVSITGDLVAINGDVAPDGPRLWQHASDHAHPIVVPDLLNSDVYTDRYLARNKIRGALVVPLRLQNASFGALGACSRKRIDFEVDAIYVAETIAHLVATTLAHYRSEALLQEHRRLTETLYDTIDAMILVINGAGRVEAMNRACTEISGFSRDDFADRPIWSVLAPPEAMPVYRDAIASVVAIGPPLALEAPLLTKHSDRRIVAWRFAPMPDVASERGCFLMTGIDITRQRLAEERAERARKALAHLRPADDGSGEPGGAGLVPSGRSGELASGRRPSESERRLKPRRPYPYRQSIAYMSGNAYPAADKFIEVRCRDVAAGGFSFVSPQPPDGDQLIIALGSPRHLTYLTARVVHVTQVIDNHEAVHLIGCQYTGRAPN